MVSRPRSNPVAIAFRQPSQAALLLVHPFYAANKGVKYPDADSSASIPITIRAVRSIPVDTVGTLYGGALRVFPAPFMQAAAGAVINAAGEITDYDWSTATLNTAADWVAYRANFRAYRVVNFGVKLSYTGNTETDGGRYTIQTFSWGSTTSGPIRPDDTTIWATRGAIKDLKGQVFEPRSLSIERLHYEPVNVATPTTEIAEFADSWEAIIIAIEASSDQPVTAEIVWNLECLPTYDAITSAIASPAAPDQMHVLAQSSNLASTSSREVHENSRFAEQGGTDFATAIGHQMSAAAGQMVGQAMQSAFH